MSRLFLENGLLTEEGKEFFAPVQDAVDSLLNSDEFKSMNEAQLRGVGVALAKLVGDTVSWKLQDIRDVSKMDNKIENLLKESAKRITKFPINGVRFK